jgi:hypothetical protein
VRRLASLALLVAAAAAAGAALAGTDPRDAKERLKPTDMRLAKGFLLSASDLGPGWKPRPSWSAGDSNFACPGYDPDFSAFTITGKGEATYAHTGGAQVMSVAEVYKTRAQAVGDFRLETKPQVAGCLRYIMNKEIRESAGKVKFTVVSSQRVSAPDAGERAAAYRLAIKADANGRSVPVIVDVVVLQQSRSAAGLFFIGPLVSVPNQAAYARLVAARMQ